VMMLSSCAVMARAALTTAISADRLGLE